MLFSHYLNFYVQKRLIISYNANGGSMNIILKVYKKYNYLLITFILSFLIIGVIYKLQKIAPLGNNSMLTVDFYHQYGPMLAELYDRIKNGGNLIYSFNTGLGLPFFRNFFNYLSSLFNIIILLFKRENIVMSYSIIIALKAIASSLTMSILLKNKFKFKSNIFIGLSLLYAFSAYYTAYYWNIMWLDGMVFLPIIVLGIENIINNNNGILYTISLSLMLLSNYFIGYMICLFSVIYFISYLIIKTKKINFKDLGIKTLKFMMCSILSACLVAWALLPMLNALSTTNATEGSMPTSQYYYFSLLEFFENQLTGVKSTVFASDISNAPNTTCGILCIGLFILFLLNEKISLKRKIVYSSILLFLLASFYIAPLDYIWHAFHVPNDLPYRYSFLYTFTLIIICGYSLKYINTTKNYKIIVSFIITLIFISIVKLLKYKNIDNDMLTLNYLLITVYFLTFILKKYLKKTKNIPIYLILLVIAMECVFSVNNNWLINHDIKTFYAPYYKVKNTLNKIKETDKDKFYRIERNDLLTLNDGAWFGYYGQATFSSMAYNSLAELNNDLGMPGNNINSYYYKQNTPIYDIMFDIKYIYDSNQNNSFYTLFDQNDDFKVYKFNYSLGLMFAVNDTIKNWTYNYTNPLEYQNDFIKLSTGIEDTFTRLNMKQKDIIYQNDDETVVNFKYETINDNIYLYSNSNLINYIIINNTAYYKENTDINDMLLKTNANITNFVTYDEAFIINENTLSDETDVIVSFNYYLNEEIEAYEINNFKFTQMYNILKQNVINITKFNEKDIEANINLNKNMSIFTSIPYDDGWKIFVNNKLIKTYKINNSLLGFDLKKGNNNIKIVYTPKYLNVGILISIISLIIALSYLIIKKTNQSN